MKVGDLVRVKDAPFCNYGVVLLINKQHNFADVYWCIFETMWSFFEEDLVVIQ